MSEAHTNLFHCFRVDGRKRKARRPVDLTQQEREWIQAFVCSSLQEHRRNPLIEDEPGMKLWEERAATILRRIGCDKIADIPAQYAGLHFEEPA